MLITSNHYEKREMVIWGRIINLTQILFVAVIKNLNIASFTWTVIISLPSRTDPENFNVDQ